MVSDMVSRGGEVKINGEYPLKLQIIQDVLSILSKIT